MEVISCCIFIPPIPEGRGGYTVLPLSVCPSKIFFWTHQIPTSCLPTLLIFLHIEHICSFFVAFLSATIDGRDLIFGHKLHIGTPYRGKRFLTVRFLLPVCQRAGVSQVSISSQIVLFKMGNIIFIIIVSRVIASD